MLQCRVSIPQEAALHDDLLSFFHTLLTSAPCHTECYQPPKPTSRELHLVNIYKRMRYSTGANSADPRAPHSNYQTVLPSPLKRSGHETRKIACVQLSLLRGCTCYILCREGHKIVVSGAPLLKKQSFMYGGEKMDFTWEEAGISLHFPAATCKGGIKVTVKVLKNVEDYCIMPRGYRLMPMASAVYKITANAKLPAPVRVKMQHCAIIDKEDTLVHMVAPCTPPYRFEPYHKGKFPHGESYGEVEITQFSVWTALWSRVCQLFHLRTHLAIYVVYLRNSTAHIAVTKNIPAHRTAVEEEYPNATKVDSYAMICPFTTTEITFSEAEPDSQEGWKIQMAPIPTTISLSSICGYEIGCVIPKIELEPEWTMESGQPKQKKVQIKIEGGSIQSFPFLCNPPGLPQALQDQSPQAPHQNPSLQDQPSNEDQQTQPLSNQSQLNRSDPPTLPLLLTFPKQSGDKINIVERIGTKNHTFGIKILEDNFGTVTDAIETEYGPNQTRITDAILSKWLEGTGRTPISWGTLITVLREIGLNVLADEMDDNLLQ